MNHPNGSPPEISAPEFLKWLLRRRKRFLVTGASMFPILKPGDEVLIDPRAYHKRIPKVGEIVVAIHPQRQDVRVIKRVVSVTPEGNFNLEGENPFGSTDFRGVPAGTILGRVTCVFSRGGPTAAPEKED